MFLHNKTSKITSKTLKLPVKLDFSATHEDLSASYNVMKCASGVKTVFKRDTMKFSLPVRKIVGVNKDDYMFVMTDKGIAQCRNEANSSVFFEKFGSDPTSCVYRGSTVVSAKEFGTYSFTGINYTKLCDDGFSSLTACADRIFGLNGKEVSYTSAGTSDGWKQGQTVTLPSACQAVASIGDKVYALGNDVYALVPKADDIEFKVAPLARNVGAVVRDSVANYNETVVFATVNGLYRLSSDKVTPIFQELNDVLDLTKSTATVFQGKYYVSARCEQGSSKTNDVTLCLDLDKGVAGVLMHGYQDVSSTRTQIFCVSDGVCYAFNQNIGSGTYCKSNVDFGTSDKKFLDKLLIKTLTDVSVTIKSETESRQYRVKGSKNLQKINLHDMGWQFSIKLHSDRGVDVQSLTLVAHTVKEV